MNTTTSKHNLKRVYNIEAYGYDNKKFVLELYMDIGRELGERDENIIREMCGRIEEGIGNETYLLNPKYQQQGIEERAKLLQLFGEEKIFTLEIPNEYRKDDPHFKWLMVTTKVGHIKIGWRKRVINIDWSGTIIKESGIELFPTEEVTREGKSIHAYGYEKAQEYIDKLLSHAR